MSLLWRNRSVERENLSPLQRRKSSFCEDSPRRIFQLKTIEELKQYCAEHGMPLRRVRFFVGQIFQEPKASSICKAGDNHYVVYKNKADGSRAVRNDNPDEHSW